LKGWQAVCRVSDDEKQMLTVVHSFEDREEPLTITLPGENMAWEAAEIFCREGISTTVKNGMLTVNGLTKYDGLIVLLNKM
jgi:hypothetical protein